MGNFLSNQRVETLVPYGMTEHISKYTALTYVADIYKIKNEHILAFGDGINDVEMIRDVGVGVAMKNGVDVVKAVAKHFTEYTNKEDGIANYLIDFFNLS